MPILTVKNLSVSFQNHPTLSGISFQLYPKKITALVGQSGSGKSTVALAITKLVRKAEISGEIIFQGENLLKFSEKKLCTIRGKEIGFIFQDPGASLNPLHPIGKQIAEAITIHNPKISKKNLQSRVVQLLTMVELENFITRLDDYPHQLSGGQKQRVMIAIAMANNPKILIADEPTTALDSVVQNEILELLLRLKNEVGIGILFISHNLRIVKKIADEVIVLNEGKIVERGNIEEIFSHPKNDYTKLLINAVLKHKRPAKRDPTEEILSVKNLSVVYKIRKSFFKKENFYANSNINFSLQAGENLGIIGESGSGKSTMALALCNLISHQGEIIFFGKKTWQKNNFDLHRDIQIIFQDPFASLNPRMTVQNIIEEGLLIHGIYRKIDPIMDSLHLDLKLKSRYPHELSGGQRQRVAIARALILEPKILVLDEPTSALDVFTQNEILKSLLEIQQRQKISYILISHDLDVVTEIADKIIILRAGQIVENDA